MNPAKKRLYTALTALAVVAAVIISRKPILLVEPRFFWDEGMVNYAFAFKHSWLATLLTPHQGYFSLLNNISTLASFVLVEMEHAPFITTYTAFFIHLIPHMVIWGGRSPYWDTLPRRIFASLLIMFDSMGCAIWLNSVTGQFHLSLVTFLLLMEEWKGRSRRCIISYCCLLVLAGLTGVVSCFLMPFFLLKYYYERSAAGKAFCITIFSACVFAFLGVVWFKLYGELYKDEQRFSLVGAHRYLMFLARGTVANMLMGSNNKFAIYSYGRTLWNFDRVLVPSLLFLAFISIYFTKHFSKLERILFLGSFYVMSAFNLLASIASSRGQSRYFYAANVVMGLIVMQNMFLPDVPQNRVRRLLASGLMGVILLMGMWDFYGVYTCYNPQWPKWVNEVGHWRHYPDYIMVEHPVPDWTVDLRPDVSPGMPDAELPSF